jgi:hypothetical protein
MVTKASWVAGLGQGLTWGTAINSGDLNTGGTVGMPTANTVLSTVADIANGTALDMFMDISVSLLIASSTIVAGANLAFYLYELNQDGTTYGDNQFTAGTFAAKTPTVPPCASITLVPLAGQTTLIGYANQISIPPGSFRLAIMNNSGFTLTTGTQTVKYRTYNLAMT